MNNVTSGIYTTMHRIAQEPNDTIPPPRTFVLCFPRFSEGDTGEGGCCSVDAVIGLKLLVVTESSANTDLTPGGDMGMPLTVLLLLLLFLRLFSLLRTMILSCTSSKAARARSITSLSADRDGHCKRYWRILDFSSFVILAALLFAIAAGDELDDCGSWDFGICCLRADFLVVDPSIVDGLPLVILLLVL